MPALPSFMSYRPQLKDKVKSSFAIAKKRLEGGPSNSSIAQPTQTTPSSSELVLDIGSDGGKDSMDFYDAGSPQFGQPQGPVLKAPSPRLQLELNLRAEEEGLSDWFATSFPRPEPSPNPRGNGKPTTIEEEFSDDEGGNEILRGEEVFENRIETMSSGDVIANLEAMNVRSQSTLARDTHLDHFYIHRPRVSVDFDQRSVYPCL